MISDVQPATLSERAADAVRFVPAIMHTESRSSSFWCRIHVSIAEPRAIYIAPVYIAAKEMSGLAASAVRDKRNPGETHAVLAAGLCR